MQRSRAATGAVLIVPAAAVAVVGWLAWRSQSGVDRDSTDAGGGPLFSVGPRAAEEHADQTPDAERQLLVRDGSIWSELPDGSGQTRITDGEDDRDPTWGPDHRRVAFCRGNNVWVCEVSRLVARPSGAGGQLVFSLSAAGAVTAEVLNIAGRPIRTIVTDRPMPAGVNSLSWDGRSNVGLAVPNGTYLIRLTTRSDSGAQAQAVTTLQVAR